jgi:colanic acid biosynthesis glycosyl transferase WcaI
MRVVVVSCVFPPEPIVSAQTSIQIAEELVRRGHDVTVLTSFPSKPAGRIYPGYRRRLCNRSQADTGFELIRCFSFFSTESRIASRFLENLSFGLMCGLVLLTNRRPDVIYANTWPIIAAGLLFLMARWRQIPLVASVQDVYPESLIAQRRLRASAILTRWMRWIDGFIARGCSAIIVISERFAEIYRVNRGVEQDRVHVVPNWSDSRSLVLDDQSDQFRAAQGIPQEAFLMVYAGNIGMAAGVETVIEAFRHLRDEQPAHLLVAGEGSNLATCQALAREVPEGRIWFYTPWPVEETSTVLRAADVLVLPTRGSQSLASVPSKLISYMLAARPVVALAVADSDIARIIEQAGCGWVVEPDQPEILAMRIRQIMALEPVRLARRGEYGRRFALRNLTREACLPAVIDILESAVLP